MSASEAVLRAATRHLLEADPAYWKIVENVKVPDRLLVCLELHSPQTETRWE